jgi:hypothetical protein
MTSPIERSSQCSRKHGNGQRLCEAEQKHAQTRSEKPAEKNLLAPDPVAEPAPENTTHALHEGKCRSDHADIHRDLALIVCDLEVFDHVVRVREDGHECNRFAYPAECYHSVRMELVGLSEY